MLKFIKEESFYKYIIDLNIIKLHSLICDLGNLHFFLNFTNKENKTFFKS